MANSYLSIVLMGRSSSYRTPCPEGTSLGTGLYNGTTILLVCDAAFNAQEVDTELLAYGLGFGLGIPVVLLLLCWYANGFTFPCFASKVQPRIESPTELKKPLSSQLSEGAYSDFSFDILSDQLKHEIMILRIREGRNLTDLIKEAEAKNAFEIATWIDHLNPGEIPIAIRQKAIAQKTPEV